MPSDITGSDILNVSEDGTRTFVFRKGPLFANVVLADEINRTGPKTQASLLEAMQERQITSDGKTYVLPKPFTVLATQNPLESEGTYPLPDAQLDRFSIKVKLNDPTMDDAISILRGTTSTEEINVTPIFAREEASQKIMAYREQIEGVSAHVELLRQIVMVCTSLNPGHPEGIEDSDIKAHVDYGPSPRGMQAVLRLAKFYAYLDGRMNVAEEDLLRSYSSALRHRVVQKIESEADGSVSTDSLIEKIVAIVHG